jgi:Na+/melibiose symporter-like transporter
MFVGCFCYGAFLYLLLNPPYGGATFLSIWFGATYTLFFLADTFTNIPYNALGAELSEDSNERTGLFFVSGLFDGFGTLVALSLPTLMVAVASGLDINAAVCKPEAEVASLCSQGRSCSNFITSGNVAAFQDDLSLLSQLGPIVGQMVPPGDTAVSCTRLLAGQAQSILPLGNGTLLSQNQAFCTCVQVCSDACDMAVKRTSFNFVGLIFAAWYIVTSLVCVYHIRERKIEKTAQQMPLVPSLLSAAANGPFRILLPAWVFDAICRSITTTIMPFFVEVVVQPNFLTMEYDGIDCSPSSASFDGGKWIGLAGKTDWRCDSFRLLTVCFGIVLLSAVLAIPVWNFLVHKIGKVKCWLTVSLCYAVSFCMMFFLFRGWITFMLIIAVFQGFPVAGSFLADGILADIIDYDEFLTTSRSEATYFMFKSFLPKMVQIVTSALPLAFMATVGYRPVVGGKPQAQPFSVHLYMKFIILLSILSAAIAFLIKLRYPLKTDDDLEEIATGIVEHRKGKVYPDPITGVPYKPLETTEDEEETVSLLYHFKLVKLGTFFIRHGCEAPVSSSDIGPETSVSSHESHYVVDTAEGTKKLSAFANFHLVVCAIALVSAVSAASATMYLIGNPTWQFIPTLAVILVGLFTTMTLFASLRKRAADRLLQLSRQAELCKDLVTRVLWHRATVAELGVEREEKSDGAASEGVRSARSFIIEEGRSVRSLAGLMGMRSERSLKLEGEDNVAGEEDPEEAEYTI